MSESYAQRLAAVQAAVKELEVGETEGGGWSSSLTEVETVELDSTEHE